uniref:Uncharacterized protein n=1 Tax=Romanomermis culicivorax TaxID=13658 RepID=A0A915JSS5_ROMCU
MHIQDNTHLENSKTATLFSSSSKVNKKRSISGYTNMSSLHTWGRAYEADATCPGWPGELAPIGPADFSGPNAGVEGALLLQLLDDADSGPDLPHCEATLTTGCFLKNPSHRVATFVGPVATLAAVGGSRKLALPEEKRKEKRKKEKERERQKERKEKKEERRREISQYLAEN